MYKTSVVLLIFIIFLSCSRNKNINSNETVIENDNILLENTNQIITNNIGLPKIMYVNSETGLRVRSEPSINGNINGLLLFGTRIIINEKSEMPDTINDISAYWYKIGDYRNRDAWVSGWIFGGYISEELPSNLPIVLGKWDNINSEIAFDYFIEAISFFPDNEFSHTFRKETSNGISGSWNLNDNNLMIFDIIPRMDYMAANFGLSDEDDWSVVLENNRLPSQSINLTIIDKNNIILEFVDRIVELKRSDDLW
ncbi:MAG: SH3 domain-containing protein [Spirochaetaceae bacterium]|nr:SH3 domain-containing protein [Spirochaetaceae bacterium]